MNMSRPLLDHEIPVLGAIEQEDGPPMHKDQYGTLYTSMRVQADMPDTAIDLFCDELHKFLNGRLHIIWRTRPKIGVENGSYYVYCRLTAYTSDQIEAKPSEANMSITGMDFGQALQCLKNGHKVCRQGWNGKGMWIALQVPDAGAKMTLPYLYMKTADAQLVPWLASQTDILAQDWWIA